MHTVVTGSASPVLAAAEDPPDAAGELLALALVPLLPDAVLVFEPLLPDVLPLALVFELEVALMTNETSSPTPSSNVGCISRRRGSP